MIESFPFSLSVVHGVSMHACGAPLGPVPCMAPHVLCLGTPDRPRSKSTCSMQNVTKAESTALKK